MLTRLEALRKQQQAEQEDDAVPKGNGDRTGNDLPAADETVIEGTSARASQAPASHIPTEQFLSVLMESITRAQAEANRNLISSLLYPTAGDFRTSSPITAHSPSTSTASSAAAGGNFCKCTARFDGSAHDGEVLEAFLDSVEVYKECAAVSDDHALRGLPMLLEGEAAIWWRGVKASVASWSDAISRLRAIYGVTQPAHKIFRKIFADEQQDNERAEVFLCRIRALLAKLPYALPEIAQVDICYGLLHRRVKKRVPRECVDSLDKLLCSARNAEDAIKEAGKVPILNQASSQINNIRDSKMSPTIVKSPTASASVSHSRSRTRCTYCRIFGHTVEECRNRENVENKAMSKTTKSNSDSSDYVLRCYGCGKSGVVRTKCDICNPNSVKKPIDLNSAVISCIRLSNCSKNCDIEAMLNVDGKSDVECTSDVGVHQISMLDPISGAHPISRVSTKSTNKSDIEAGPISRVSTMSESTYDIEGRSDIESTSDINGRSQNTKRGEPLVEVGIMGRTGVAIIDTGATHCIASPMLHKVLVDSGAVFHDTEQLIRLADGSSTSRKLLMAKVLVSVKGREVPAEFLVLPGAATRTLLGLDFLVRAGMVVDIARGKWSFADDPEHQHDFVRHYTMKTQLKLAEAVDLSVRDGNVGLEKKRSLIRESAAVLGHVIAPGGIQVDPVKVTAVKDTVVPQNTKHASSGFQQLENPGVSRSVEDLETEESSRGRPWRFTRCTFPYGSQHHESNDEEPRLPHRSTASRQEVQNRNANEEKRLAPKFKVGDVVSLVTPSTNLGRSAKFNFRRDSLHTVAGIISPTTYRLADIGNGGDVGIYHISHLTPFVGPIEHPIREKRKRSRPRRYLYNRMLAQQRGRNVGLEGEHVTRESYASSQPYYSRQVA